MQITVQFNAKLPIKIRKKEKWVIASCPILDIFAQGENEAKARSNLKETLSLFFISCFERGTLDAVLKKCGFKATPPVKIKTKSVAEEQDYINIPIPFLVDQHSQVQCHA